MPALGHRQDQRDPYAKVGGSSFYAGLSSAGSQPELRRTSRCIRRPGVQHESLGDRRRQPHFDEQLRLVEIILAGLVNDPNVALSRSGSIRDNLIELALFKILR